MIEAILNRQQNPPQPKYYIQSSYLKEQKGVVVLNHFFWPILFFCLFVEVLFVVLDVVVAVVCQSLVMWIRRRQSNQSQ